MKPNGSNYQDTKVHPWIFHWNCRGFANKCAELKLQLERMGKRRPAVLLLQETNHENVKLNGYKTYTEPSITRTIHHGNGKDAVTAIIGQVAILVQEQVPHARI